MERAEKKKKRLAKKAAKQRSLAKSKRTNKDKDSTSGLGQASAVAMAGFTSSVQGILRGRTNTLIRRRGSAHEGEGDRGESGRDIELDNMPRRPIRSNTAPTTPATRTGTRSGTGAGAPENSPQVGFSASTHSGSQGRPHLSSNSETSSTSHTPSLNPPRTIGQFLSYPTTWLWVYLRQLRRAHEDAAKKQAIERAERRQKVFGEHVGTKERVGVGADEAEMGWGLGAFGIREHEEGERRLEEARGRLRSERLLPDGSGEGQVAVETEEGGNRNEVGDPGPSTLSASIRQVEAEAQAEARTSSDSARHRATPRPEASRETTATSARPTTNRRRNRPGEEEWTDVDHDDDHDDSDDSDSSDNGDRRGRGRGWSWWGPLRKWRLADRSTF